MSDASSPARAPGSKGALFGVDRPGFGPLLKTSMWSDLGTPEELRTEMRRQCLRLDTEHPPPMAVGHDLYHRLHTDLPDGYTYRARCFKCGWEPSK